MSLFIFSLAALLPFHLLTLYHIASYLHDGSPYNLPALQERTRIHIDVITECLFCISPLIILPVGSNPASRPDEPAPAGACIVDRVEGPASSIDGNAINIIKSTRGLPDVTCTTTFEKGGRMNIRQHED